MTACEVTVRQEVFSVAASTIALSSSVFGGLMLIARTVYLRKYWNTFAETEGEQAAHARKATGPASTVKSTEKPRVPARVQPEREDVANPAIAI